MTTIVKMEGAPASKATTDGDGMLLDLEAIERIMVEKQNKKLKAKGKASTAWPGPKSNPKCKASGGPTGRVPNKGRSEKFCQRCKAHGGPYQTHNTLNCHCCDSNGKPLKAAAPLKMPNLI